MTKKHASLTEKYTNIKSTHTKTKARLGRLQPGNKVGLFW